MSSPRYARVRDLPELATAPDPGDVLEIETVDGASRRVSVATLGASVGVPEGESLGAILLAAEQGKMEQASIYPILINNLTLAFRSAAATILALHRARSK